MSKQDMVEIAFPSGGIIPAKVLGEAKDVQLNPHEPRNVPKAYAEHLIADRIAYDHKARQKQLKLVEEQKSAALQNAQDQADKQAVIEKLQADFTALTDERNGLADDLATATAELDEVKEQVATLESELETSKAANLELTAQLQAAEADASKQGALKIDGNAEKTK